MDSKCISFTKILKHEPTYGFVNQTEYSGWAGLALP